MALTFIGGTGLQESLALCSLSIVKWRLLERVDYRREMTAKKSCKCGEYGSFEQLLFLFICVMLKMHRNSREVIYNSTASLSAALDHRCKTIRREERKQIMYTSVRVDEGRVIFAVKWIVL